MEVHQGTFTYGVDQGALEAIVRRAGFEPYTYDAVQRQLINSDFGHAHQLSDNVLMIRNVEAVRRRILEAPHFSFHGVCF